MYPSTETRALLEAMDEPAAVVTADLELQWPNAAFVELTGSTREALLRTPIADLITSTTWPQLEAAFEMRPSSRDLSSRETWVDFVESSGHIATLQAIVATIAIRANSDDGADSSAGLPRTEPAFLLRLRDRSESKRRRLQQRVTERALHAAASGIVICDASSPDVPMTYVNAAFEKITGYAASDVLGQNCRFLSRGDREQPGLREIREAIAARRETTVTLRNFRKDGSSFWNELTISPLADEHGNVTHFIGIQDDITERMEFTAERERLLAEAMQERQAAERASRARDTLLAVVSHELRSPLNGIRLWTSLLRDDPAPDHNLIGRVVDHVEQAVTTQSRLIEDLLDVTRFESGRLELRRQPQDLVEILRDVAQANQPAATKHTLKLEFLAEADKAIAVVDRSRVEQVAQNLIDNACKFTPAGGRITIAISTSRIDNMAVVTVQDTGAGLPAEKLEAVFEPYWQASGRDTDTHGGLGLGLHLVKRLVELHGGSVAAHSDGLGQGAAIEFRLPLRSEPKRAREGAHATTQPVASIAGEVLVVDDDPATVEALGLGLRMRGIDVRLAGGVEEAVAALEQSRPRALISDLMMGASTGFELVQMLRNSEFDQKSPRIPAIAISGRGDPGDERAAWLAGFDLYLKKPISVALLSEHLERVLTERAQLRSPTSVLIADSDAARGERLRDVLLTHEHAVQTAESAAHALAIVDATPIDAVIASTHLADGAGVDLLQSLRSDDDEIMTVLVGTQNEAPDPSASAKACGDIFLTEEAPPIIARALYAWRSPTRR
ncbi:MAG: ATP-binding protein [Planctomycetota bacterium]